MVHGGEIRDKRIRHDFSINVNPLGMPSEVGEALIQGLSSIECYPDRTAETLRRKLADFLSIQKNQILMGNGASELITAAVRALEPKRVLIAEPTFSGYERAAKAVGAEVIHYFLKEEASFWVTEDFPIFLKNLGERGDQPDLIFLCNPNNPTGAGIGPDILTRILTVCETYGIFVLLDECFLSFLPDCRVRSRVPDLVYYPHLLVLGAFTKIFAIPGLRLGTICASEELIERMARQVSEWNVSSLAQIAGMRALDLSDYLKDTWQVVQKERDYCMKDLREMGMQTYEGEADFILFRGPEDLFPYLLERGMLIRTCDDFPGLNSTYYRIGVKNHEENRILMQAIREFVAG